MWKIFSPTDFSDKVAGFLHEKTEFQLEKSTGSKALSKLERNDILEGVEYKQNLKKEFPQLYIPGRGKSEKKEGFPVRYKLTDNVRDYMRLLKDPKALELINQNLLSYDDLLAKFYRKALSDILDLIIKNEDPDITKFFSVAIAPLNSGKGPSQSDWDAFRDKLSKLSNDEREGLVN